MGAERWRRRAADPRVAATLTVAGLHGHYGSAHVLMGIDFEAAAGSAVAVLGRNGAGKSSFFKAIAGTADLRTSGSVTLGEARLDGRRADQVARLGVQLVPEDRRVLSSLSVRENLKLAARAAALVGETYLDEVLAVFPEIERFLESGGAELSGGQQQMVAVARALVSRPRLLLLDEPSTGLAPVVVEHMLESLIRMREFGATMLVAEQNVGFALDLCDEIVILEKGRVVFAGSRDEVRDNAELRASYLEV